MRSIHRSEMVIFYGRPTGVGIETPEHPVARNQLLPIIILENDCLVLENRTGAYTIKQILFKYDHEEIGKKCYLPLGKQGTKYTNRRVLQGRHHLPQLETSITFTPSEYLQ